MMQDTSTEYKYNIFLLKSIINNQIYSLRFCGLILLNVLHSKNTFTTTTNHSIEHKNNMYQRRQQYFVLVCLIEQLFQFFVCDVMSSRDFVVGFFYLQPPSLLSPSLLTQQHQHHSRQQNKRHLIYQVNMHSTQSKAMRIELQKQLVLYETAASETMKTTMGQNRRTILQKAIISGTSLVATIISPLQSIADDTSGVSTTNQIINQLLSALHTIPTYCIVNKMNGASYMIYKRDIQMGIGYAFLTYDGAVTVLNDAQQNAIETRNKMGGSTTTTNDTIWTNATITTIPLDVAVRLTLKKRSRTNVPVSIGEVDDTKNDTNNKKKTNQVMQLDTLLQVIPGANERFDGLAIDKQRFQDQGRVPIFFIPTSKTTENSSSNNNVKKFYFNRKDLINDYIKEHPGESVLPNNIDAIDLIGIFESLLLGRNVESKIGTALLNDLLGSLSSSSSTPSTTTIQFIPDSENILMAKQMKEAINSNNNQFIQYNPNLMIL